MADEDAPVNRAMLLALAPFAAAITAVTVNDANTKTIRPSVTAGDIRAAKLAFDNAVAYKYADRDKMINVCLGIVENMDGIADLAQRQMRRQIADQLRSLKPIYVP